jgi:hypothetical protein
MATSSGANLDIRLFLLITLVRDTCKAEVLSFKNNKMTSIVYANDAIKQVSLNYIHMNDALESIVEY